MVTVGIMKREFVVGADTGKTDIRNTLNLVKDCHCAAVASLPQISIPSQTSQHSVMRFQSREESRKLNMRQIKLLRCLSHNTFNCRVVNVTDFRKEMMFDLEI